MVKRLKEARKTLGFNQTDFAKHLGITQTAYSMIESGNRPFADKYAKVICATFGVSEQWLRSGSGEMFVSTPYEKEFSSIFSKLAPETQKYLLLMAKELLETQNKLLDHQPKQVVKESPPTHYQPIASQQEIESELADYRAELEAEQKGVETLSVSGNIKDA